MRRGFTADAEIREFYWTGLNRHDARLRAGQELAQVIAAQPSERRIHIVGHSHGGNIALVAANHLPARRVQTIVLLANPHLTEVTSRDTPPRWMYWGNAAELVRQIWNIYSPEDRIQVSVAQVFHGVGSARRGRIL